MLVLDASVALKWLIPEENWLEAHALLNSDLALAAPSLIVSEVAAGLSSKARVNFISHAEAHRALGQWLSSFATGDALILYPDTELIPDALSLALELDYLLPECLYLALARRLNAPLVTADELLISRVGQHNALNGNLRVMRLGDDLSGGSAGHP